jgi:hypothetical protein
MSHLEREREIERESYQGRVGKKTGVVFFWIKKKQKKWLTLTRVIASGNGQGGADVWG